MASLPRRVMHRLPHRPLLLAASAALATVAALAPRPALALDHCGQVTTNQTWSSADNPHDICAEGVSIRNSTLRVLPGALVRFHEGANLVIESGAGMVAVGDAQNAPIRFLALPRTPTRGYWGQIRFDSGAITSTIEAAFVSYGGRDGKPMVEVRSPAAEIFNVTFIQSADVPLQFSADALGPSTFRAGSNTVRTQRCPLIAFSDVGKNAISVDATADVDVAVDATWANFCTPYLVNGTVTVAGPIDIAPTLTLSQGTQLKFDAAGGIVTGLSADLPGHLVTSGQVDVLEHVLITGQVEEPGSWGGIHLSEFSTIDNSLINTDVKYGGRNGVPMIRVRDIHAYALDLTMRHAKAYPLELPSTAVDSFLGSMVAPKNVQPPIKDNGIDRALVLAKDIPLDVPRSAIWGDIEAPYEIDGDVMVASVDGKDGTPASLRILPGAHLLFADGAALRIGDPSGPRARFAAGPVPVPPSASRAALAAAVTDAVLAPEDAAAAQGGETILGALSGTPGAWKGIVFADTTVEAQLESVRIENGGQDGAMVQWGTVRGSILKSTFAGSAGYPISLPLTHIDVIAGIDQKVAANRSRFENNAVNRVLVRSAGELTQRQITLASPGTGIEFDGDVLFAGGVTPLVDVEAGLDLYLRPGKVFKLGDGVIRANVRLNDARSNNRVAFLPAEPGKPHGGVQIGAGSSLREAEDSTVAIDISGAGAGDAFLAVDGALDVSGLVLTGDAQSTGATGLLVRDGGEAAVAGPRLSKLAVGARVLKGGRLVLQKGWITECSQWGVQNEDSARCTTAALIWWGDEAGPLDASEAEDGCMNAANESAGTKVTDDVDWEGFAIDTDLTPFGGVRGEKTAYLPYGVRNVR